jgi:hypothetical protein
MNDAVCRMHYDGCRMQYEGCSMKDAVYGIQYARWQMQYTGCIIAYMRDAHMQDACMQECKMQKCRIQKCRMQDAVRLIAWMHECRTVGCGMQRKDALCKMQGCSNVGIHDVWGRITICRMQECRIQECRMQECRIHDAGFRDHDPRCKVQDAGYMIRVAAAAECNISYVLYNVHVPVNVIFIW